MKPMQENDLVQLAIAFLIQNGAVEKYQRIVNGNSVTHKFLVDREYNIIVKDNDKMTRETFAIKRIHGYLSGVITDYWYRGELKPITGIYIDDLMIGYNGRELVTFNDMFENEMRNYDFYIAQ